MAVVAAGVIRTPSAATDAARLRQLHDALRSLLAEHRPQRVAVERLASCSAAEVIITNTLPLSDDKRFDKLTELSIAPLLGKAIREVFEDGSVTSLFDGKA